ncbi:MAG TPA: hypothetical protein VF276_03600, partial [Chloroflexia bacterium]
GQMVVEVVVPPNSRARVTLPGGDGSTIEVGSGSRRWSYPYQAPQPARRALTLDSSLREVIDDPAAWDATLRTIRRYMPEYNTSDIGQNGNLAMPLRGLFQFGHYPNRDQVLAGIAEALRAAAPLENTEAG